jgi:flagellar biosynthesis protein
VDGREERKKAVAILYEGDAGSAPKVVAGGQGHIAEKIIASALEAGIHIEKDANLVELLAKVEIGAEIPVELYQTVAEVLAFVYRVDRRFKEKVSNKNK